VYVWLWVSVPCAGVLRRRAGGAVSNGSSQANRNKPTLRSFDRFGNRVDVVDFHPAYHECMRRGVEAQVPSFAWNNAGKPGAMVVRSALAILHYQASHWHWRAVCAAGAVVVCLR
jgi:hypothetical protein